jgi:2-polyprenyl-3-methyl-5-hydroxy-6-metoxy-1,4-benzoquinol methylase
MHDGAIAHNRAAHDRVADVYDSRHPEIFNDVEQARLASVLGRILPRAGRGDGAVRALDVGCGTGNLTRHLLALGAHVTAADLSPKLLDEVGRRFGGSGRLELQRLNGTDLQPLTSGSFDFVAAYSVLHHVPDYVAFVREMARVTRPGGLVMIDHERTDASWNSADYRAFMAEAIVWPDRRWWYWLQPSRYWKRVRPLLEWRRRFDPRWMPEGDLHIWPDDHIEWARIERALADGGCATEESDEYLLFEPRFERAVWERWRTRCSDMRVLIARRAA